MRFFRINVARRLLATPVAFAVLAGFAPASNAGLSGAPSITADGKKVAFMSSTATSENANLQIVVHDLETGARTLVSVGPDGVPGNSDSFSPTISADGRYVVFESHADNLAAGDENNAQDVFLRDLHEERTIIVSRNIDNTGTANAKSERAVLCREGAAVMFSSYANDIHPSANPPQPSLYRYDVGSEAVQHIAYDLSPFDSNGLVLIQSSMSDDGGLILHTKKDATNRVYLWSAAMETAISLDIHPPEGTIRRVDEIAISGNGTVVFVIGNWAPHEGPSSDIVLRIDLASNQFQVLSKDREISDLAKYRLLPTENGTSLLLMPPLPSIQQSPWIWRSDMENFNRVGEGLVVADAALSKDGKEAFLTARLVYDEGDPFAPLPTNFYRYDVATQELVAISTEGDDRGSFQTDGLAIADNGTIAFHTERNGIADGDTNNAFDVYTLSEESGLFDWISTVVVRARPVLNILAGSANGITLTWGVEIGRRYLVEYRNSINGDTWKALGDEEVADSDLMSANDSRDGETQRYYRVVDVTP